MLRKEYFTSRYSVNSPKSFQDEESPVIFVLFEVEAIIITVNVWIKYKFIVVTYKEKKIPDNSLTRKYFF